MDARWDARWSRFAPLPLRLMLGFGFLYHGLPKFTAEGHDMFVGMVSGIGTPAPEIVAWLVSALEVLGGLALIVGAFVTIFGTLLIIEMLVAAFAIHWPAGFNFMNITGMGEAGPEFGMPGYEVPFLYIAGLLALVLGGAGAWSVDERRRPATTTRTEEAPPPPRTVA